MFQEQSPKDIHLSFNFNNEVEFETSECWQQNSIGKKRRMKENMKTPERYPAGQGDRQWSRTGLQRSKE